MSSQNESAADLISAYASVKTDIFVDFAAMAFFVYDYAVTFGSEVNLVWKRRPSVASALVLSIRYLYLIASILSITGDALHSGERLCRAVEVTGSIAWYTVYFPVALFTGMRAYGLCGSWIIFSLVTVLSLAPMISDYVDLATRQTTVINIFGCGIEDSDTLQDAIIYSSVSRGSVIVVDAILLVITWHTLARRPMHMMHFPKSRMETISNILLWNGTQYFIVLFILNVLHISFTLTSITNFTNDGSRSPSLMTQFAYPLTCILTYRFILDLQAANQHNVRIGSDDPELQTSMDSQSSLSFVNRAIGSLASTIVPGSSAAGDEGESLTEEESQSSNTPGQSRNSATTALQH